MPLPVRTLATLQAGARGQSAEADNKLYARARLIWAENFTAPRRRKTITSRRLEATKRQRPVDIDYCRPLSRCLGFCGHLLLVGGRLCSRCCGLVVDRRITRLVVYSEASASCLSSLAGRRCWQSWAQLSERGVGAMPGEQWSQCPPRTRPGPFTTPVA